LLFPLVGCDGTGGVRTMRHGVFRTLGFRKKVPSRRRRLVLKVMAYARGFNEVGRLLWNGYQRYRASDLRPMSWYEFAAATQTMMMKSDEARRERRVAAASDSFDEVVLAEMKFAALFAHAVYRRTLDEVAVEVGLPSEDCIIAQLESEHSRPAHVIFVDSGVKSAILSIRGTKSVADMMTNLTCDAKSFLHGYAHAGMVEAAAALGEKLFPIFVDNEFDKITVVGHSYGAAVATLFAMQLNEKYPELSTKVSCFAFAPPPTISPSLQDAATAAGVCTVVLGSDLVPRLSELSFHKLVRAISEFEWHGYVGVKTNELAQRYIGQSLGEEAVNKLQDASKSILQFAARQVVNNANANTSSSSSSSSSSSNSTWQWAASQLVFAAADLMNSPQQRSESREVGQWKGSARSTTGGSNMPRVFVLAGSIVYFDHGYDGSKKVVLLLKEPEHFADLELSKWMLYDHNMQQIRAALSAVRLR